jgi:hypothetical protein
MSELELSKYFLSKKIPYVKPLYSVNLSKDSEILEWFRQSSYGLTEYFRPLFREQKSNLAYFMGAGINPNWASPYTQIYANTSDMLGSTEEVFINDMYRLVMDQVTLVISHELVPDVLPNSEDYSDKVACNVVKDWLESMNYTLDTESWRFKWEMQKKIFGESFAIVMWNPHIGDIHPLAKKYIDEDIDMVDEEGRHIDDVEELPVKLRKNMRIGDIEFINPLPWDVIIDPQINSKDSNWFYWIEYLDLDYLKKKYPKFDWETKKGKGPDTQYDVYSNTEKDNPHKRKIFYLYHRSHEFMPEGRFIVCSSDHVLINEPITMKTIINNQDLPLIHFKDVDIGMGNRGSPVLFRNCKSMSDASNRLVNQMYNNSEIESPKMMVHESSGVDAQRMPNGTTAVEWYGNQKPTIEAPPSNFNSLANLQQLLQKSMDQLALQNPLVKGETPNAQLDSFISLQYFEDIRTQLSAPAIKSHIRSMEQTYRLMITIAKDKYHPDDGRMIKILGKHNTYQLRYFDPINLQKSYDVHITTTGNLASSKAARTQMLLSVKREFPNILTDEVFADMLGLSHSKKFMNAITAAVSSAEEENQSMMSGRPVNSPERFEDLIAHWDTHRIPMQTLDFKHSSPEVQEIFLGHVAATEKLMFEQAAENPIFSQRLEQLRQFPMLYTPTPVNEPIPQPMAEQEREVASDITNAPDIPTEESNESEMVA